MKRFWDDEVLEIFYSMKVYLNFYLSDEKSFPSLLYMLKLLPCTMRESSILVWVYIYFNKMLHIWQTTQWALKEENECLVWGSISLLKINLKINLQLSAHSNILRTDLIWGFFVFFGFCFFLFCYFFINESLKFIWYIYFANQL